MLDEQSLADGMCKLARRIESARVAEDIYRDAADLNHVAAALLSPLMSAEVLGPFPMVASVDRKHGPFFGASPETRWTRVADAPKAIVLRRAWRITDEIAKKTIKPEAARELRAIAHELSPLEPLCPRALPIYKMLIELSPAEAMTTKAILDALAKQNVFVDESTFYKDLKPELERWGMMNRPRVGYYIPVEARPSTKQ